jgi:hypothetical protein
VLAQKLRQQIADLAVIVNDQNMRRRFHHLLLPISTLRPTGKMYPPLSDKRLPRAAARSPAPAWRQPTQNSSKLTLMPVR